MKQERVEAIYNELETLVITLDADPAAKGPGHMQDLISKTRGYLNRTSLILHEVHREHHTLESELDALEAAFTISSDQLLAEDNRVTRLPNIEDRRSMINLILIDERVKILELKRRTKELGFVEKAVRHRHKELDNTMSSIRMQKSLIDVEVRTGAFYGDENDASRGSLGGGRRNYVADDIDTDELDSLLSGVTPAAVEEAALAAPAHTEPPNEEEPTLPQDVGVKAVEAPKTDSEIDPDMTRFLDGDDFSDVLADLDL